MSVIDVKDRFQSKKSKNQIVAYIARADLMALAILYYRNVEKDDNKARSLLNAFSTQVMEASAIEITKEQYEAFAVAIKDITNVIDHTYEQYQKDASKYNN